MMPRTARKKSSTGIYHIILRGINGQTIFCDDEDNEKFIYKLSDYKKTCCYKLFSYCLMGNHAHLLIQEEKEGIDLIFRRIGAGFVYWYNWKYQRTGHLFQDRFKSEPVEDDAYLLTALRYIHRNPVKAGLCLKPEQYRWSSYNNYVERSGITDIDFVLDLIGKDEFIKYTNQNNEDTVLDMEIPKKRVYDSELSAIIADRFNMQPIMIQNEAKEMKEYLLREILRIEGVSTRQLARITGIPINMIWTL
jgi:REP element-mobilizing transposase RayT